MAVRRPPAKTKVHTTINHDSRERDQLRTLREDRGNVSAILVGAGTVYQHR